MNTLKANPQEVTYEKKVCFKCISTQHSGLFFLHKIRPGKINDYRIQRKKFGAKAETINHELGLIEEII